MTRSTQPRRIPLLVATDRRRDAGCRDAGRRAVGKEAPGNLFKSMPQKRDEPIKISSATLEVRDKSKMATFSGDVHVVQGETNVRCNELVVFYEANAARRVRKRRRLRRAAPGCRRPGGRPADPAHGSPRLGGRDPEGSARGRRPRRVRHAHQHRDPDRKRRRHQWRQRRCAASGWSVDLNTGVARMGLESGGGRVEGIFSRNRSSSRGKQIDPRLVMRRPAGQPASWTPRTMASRWRAVTRGRRV